jgi:hypothetical protein
MYVHIKHHPPLYTLSHLLHYRILITHNRSRMSQYAIVKDKCHVPLVEWKGLCESMDVIFSTHNLKRIEQRGTYVNLKTIGVNAVTVFKQIRRYDGNNYDKSAYLVTVPCGKSRVDMWFIHNNERYRNKPNLVCTTSTKCHRNSSSGIKT